MLKTANREKLKKSYCGCAIPEFIQRLNKREVSNHPCYNCLRETKLALEKGYWKKFPNPFYFWYEMCQAEQDELNKFISESHPKKVLELGFGSGRIINIFLKHKYKKTIYAVDKDSKISTLLAAI